MLELTVGIIIFASVWFFAHWIDKRVKRKKEEAIKSTLLHNADIKLQTFLKKYDKETAVKMVNGDYWIGMTKEQVLECKGRKPDFTEIDHGKKKSIERWQFGRDIFFFENDITIRIVDRPDNDHPVKVELN